MTRWDHVRPTITAGHWPRPDFWHPTGRQFTITAVICDGERVCVESDYMATSPGNIPGWPEAGERSVSHLCSVYTVRDGLIVAACDYRDRAVP
jgi:predicted ester cyclase